MPYIKIKPQTSLFFGGGKPFDMGEETWTDSLFLPNPSTIFGALFSILFYRYLDIRKKVLDKEQDIELTDYLEIENIYLYNEKNGKVLLPAPLDLFIEEDSQRVVKEDYLEDVITSDKFKNLSFIMPDSNKNAKRVDNKFIDISYLKDRESIKELYSFDYFAVNDAKVGIAINKESKTVDEGKIYRIDLTQFKENWSFLVEYKTKNNYSLDDIGVIKLGGEGKTAIYTHIKEPTSITNHKQKDIDIIDETEFQIYFSTPAIFDKGWLFNKNDKFEIVSASIGKAIYIGGFDMKTKTHKKMYKAVPAGSIYLVELKNSVNSIVELKKLLSIESIDTKRGFGKFEILN